MWAAGVTLYNMVTGAYPFEFPGESNILGLYELICGGAFNMPDYLDTDLKHLITCKRPHPQCKVSLIDDYRDVRFTTKGSSYALLHHRGADTSMAHAQYS
jgi:serine/threonine protein kinase